MKLWTTILLLALLAPASAVTVSSSYDSATGGRSIDGTYNVAEGSTLYLSGWSQSDNGNNGGWTAMLWSITPQLNQQFKVKVSYNGVRYTRDSCELQPNSGTANYNAGCLGDDCDMIMHSVQSVIIAAKTMRRTQLLEKKLRTTAGAHLAGQAIQIHSWKLRALTQIPKITDHLRTTSAKFRLR